MAVIDIGPGATDRDSWTSLVNTSITLGNPANYTGILDTFEIYALTGYNLSGTKIGTFSGGPTNFVNRDYESIGTVTAGSKQTFTGKNCDVTSGDYLGIYASKGRVEESSSGEDGYVYTWGDVFDGESHSTTLASGRAASIYATGATAETEIQTTSNDSSTITESTGFRFSAWNATKAEIMSISEGIDITFGFRSASTFDTISAVDAVSIYIPPIIEINIHEHIRIADYVNEGIFDLISVIENVNLSLAINVYAYDSLEVTEDNTEYLGQHYITASDNIEVTEEPSQNVGQQFITTYDAVEVTEDSTLLILDNTVLASASDSIEVTEEPTQNVGQQFISTGDDIVVTEDAAILAHVCVTAYEDVGIVEAAEQYFKQKYATANDDISITDTPTASLGQLFISINDLIGIEESVAQYLGQVHATASDAIELLDECNALLSETAPVSVNVNELITISEGITLYLQQLQSEALETIGVSESIALRLNMLVIQQNESIGISESVDMCSFLASGYRTLVIAAQDRDYLIAAQDRDYLIDAANRELDI